MKRRVINSLLGVLCCFAFAACNQDMMPEDGTLRTSANAGTVYMQDFIPDRNAAVGTEVMLTDKRDNQVYRCIKMADGRWWMGENLKYNVTGSVSYNNDAANLETYGRLYKWQEAAGAIPENWDMPSDDEWKALEMALGMTKEDADAITAWRNSGNVGTQLKENSGMGLLLSGYQHTNGTFFYLGTYGRYWTSTEASSANALDRDVYSTKAGVYRGSFGKAYRYAVRCVLQVKETTQYMQTFVPNPADSVGTEVMLTDKRDGIVYRCIKMADGRWWMGENLKYNSEGSLIYDNDTANLAIYGRLYDWTTNKEYVPEGWSLPTDDEWTALREALGGVSVAGRKMKSTTGWEYYKGNGGNGTNESGWNGLPGGRRDGDYYIKGKVGYWWSAETYGCWRLHYHDAILYGPGTYDNDFHFSVRCILKEKETTQYMQTFVPNPADTVGMEVMLTDKRDNIVYRCLKMADGRWWMGENLRGRFGTFVEGQPTETYGLLYDWDSSKDYVPEGWSLPTNTEWMALANSLEEQYVAGDKMKSISGWDDYKGVSGNGSNSSGWNGLPGGFFGGDYDGKGLLGFWWSAESYGRWYLIYTATGLYGPFTDNNLCRFSVRCILNQ